MQTTQPQSTPSLEYLLTLQRFLDLAMHTAETASAEGNHRIVIQAIREGARLITLLFKLTSPQDQKQGRRPLTSTARPGLDSLLNAAPAIPGDRSACLPPGNSPPDRQTKHPKTVPGSQSPQTGNPNIETLTADLTRDLLKGMFHSLDGRENLTLENRKWEKSGKLPGKTPATRDNSKLNQKVNQYEKNPGKSTPQSVPTPVAQAF